MEKRYYILRNKIHDTMSFLTVSENKLESLIGDTSLSKKVKIEKGDLKIKDPFSHYFTLTEIEDKNEFEIHKDQYLDQLNLAKPVK